MSDLKKIPSELNSEDLLKLLETAEEESHEEPKFENDIVNFLIALGIQPGTHKVKTKLLKDFYSLWANKTIHGVSFNTVVFKYLPVEKDNRNTWVLINNTSFEFTKIAEKTIRRKENILLKSPRIKNHIDRFIEIHKIKPGDHWFEKEFLYDIYDRWTYRTKCRSPINMLIFTSLMKLYFKSKLFSKNYYQTTYFMVDPSIERLISTESKERIKKATRVEYAKSTKKKK